MMSQPRNAPSARLLAAAALGALLAGGVSAQTVPEGRLLASNCFQCHGTNGRGPGFERLAGQSANEIYKELLEYRSGKEGKGLMALHALGYSDAQLRQLATYLSTQR
jgi:cytochrome subunit of sulfide dehydrogenase